MFNPELLHKYTSWTKEELNQFYNSQFEPMVFPWLSEVKQCIETTYDIKLITITYENKENTHQFEICLYELDDYLKIVSEDGRIIPQKQHAVENFINNMVEKYMEYDNGEEIICKISQTFFKSKVLEYLYMRKSFELKNEIEALFSHLSPVYCSVENPSICVFETKEDAKRFLLGDEYNKIRKQIFDLLKPFDDYNILKESHIRIFADFRENKERIPMYSRWVHDLYDQEWDEYENSIINS